MRKVILIITVLIFTMAHSNSQGWVQQNSGAVMANFYDVKMLNASTVFAAGYYPDGYGWIYRTTNGGTNWVVSYQTQNPLNQITSVSFSSVNTGIAVGGGLFNGSFIVKTTNGGANWTTLNSGTNFYHNSVQMPDANTGYVCGQQGSILKTTDGGSSWIQQSSGTTKRLYGMYFLNSSTGTVVGDTGTVIRTTNGGSNWISQSSPSGASLNAVSMLDVNTGIAVGTSGTIIKTTNGGANWVMLTSGVSVFLRGISLINGNVCFVVGASAVILKTTNGGINWSSQLNPLTQSLGGVSFIDTLTGTAVGDNGKIIRTTNGGVTFITPLSNTIPDKFSLSQNYPNPFNPVTKIGFEIPLSRGVSGSAGRGVSLVIYDLLGREVTTLVNEELKPGTYEAEWSAANHPSGVYYYKLTTGDFSETRKMILVK